MRHLAIATALAVATGSLALSAYGQPAHDHGPAPAADAARQPFTPGLGEIMTLQLMRHAKLWLAGRASNWELAAYELDELKEGFEDVSKYFPTHDQVPLAPMVATITAGEVADLAKAIEAKDRAKFISGFDKLTQACNACHQAAKHPFIVIRRPVGSPFPNQSFAPRRK